MADFSKFSPDSGTTILNCKDTNGRIMSEELIRDTVGWTGKNLLQNNLVNGGANNVTWSVNVDKSVALSGTASALTTFTILDTKNKGLTLFKDMSLIMSKGGSETLKAGLTMWINVYSRNTFVRQEVMAIGSVDYEKAFTLDYADYDGIAVGFTVENGKATNVAVKPMIRLATISDTTYEPYHDTVSDEITDVYKVMGENGAKNYNSYPYESGNNTEINGITFTVDSQGIITANGTSTATAGYKCHDRAKNNFFLKAGTYILTASTEMAGKASITIGRTDAGGQWEQIGNTSSANGITFTITKEQETLPIHLTMDIWANKTVSDFKFYPMIRLVSDTDSTYQPYAMTNKELTDAMTVTTQNYDNTSVNAGISSITSATHTQFGRIHQINVDFSVGASNIGNWTNLFAFSGIENSGSIACGIRDLTDSARSTVKTVDVYSTYVRSAHEFLANHRYQFTVVYIK